MHSHDPDFGLDDTSPQARELRLRLFARWLDAPTMRRYYDWDSDREGL